MKENTAFWNERSRVYDAQVTVTYADAYAKTAEHALRYLSLGDRVLDFACGTGIVTQLLAPHVGSVVGVDTSDCMLARARERLSGMQNVELLCTTLYDDALAPASFDAVLAFNVLCYLPEGAQALRRIAALLRPGGVFLSATDCLGQRPTAIGFQKWVRSRTGRIPYVRFFRNAQLKRWIAQSGFTVLHVENLHPAPPNLFVAACTPAKRAGLETEERI